MLSQFKFNLRQALSCILIHQQNLLKICSTSLDPLESYLLKILPPKLYASFQTIIKKTSYTSIAQFFIHLQQLQRDITQFSTPNSKNHKSVQQNLQLSSSSYLRSGYSSKRKTATKRLDTFLNGTSSNNNIDVGEGSFIGNSSEEQFALMVFQQYAKLDGGAKKQASFAEKELFKETLNYHKIVRFLQVVKVRLTPDSRLKLLILIKKNSADSNFVKKQEFVKIFRQIKALFFITETMESQFYSKHQKQYSAKRNLFSKKLDLRSYRRPSRMTRLPSVHQSEKSTVKINPQKLDPNQSFLQKQKQRARDQEFNKSSFVNFEQEKSTAHKLSLGSNVSLPQSKMSPSKTGAITWTNLAKTKQQSNLSKNIKIPKLHLKTQSSEDQYYLTEFYKTNGIHLDTVISTTSNKSDNNSRHYQSLANIQS